MFKFGTGGWRAVIAEDFTKRNLQGLALAMAQKMQREKVADRGVILGYDRRFLSKESAIWLAEVLAAHGVKVSFIDGANPTPLVMFSVMKHDFPYGMMVTASHNPAIYNGVKVITAGGRDADLEQTRQLEELGKQIDFDQVPSIPFEKALSSGEIKIINPLNEYLDAILEIIDVKAIHDANLKIALDPMYGVSQRSIRTILLTARAQLDVINENHDTLFGGRMPAPSQAFLRNLATYVIDHRYDLGIATDGDADRLGVIDDQGRYLHANQVLVLLYYYLLAYKGWRGPVVRNLATTHQLDKIAQAYGQKCYEVPVGFKYISAKMEETQALIGGESSGGLTVHGHIRGKDGVYAASLLVEMRAVTGMPLSQLMDQINQRFGTSYMAEHSYNFDPACKADLLRRIYQNQEVPVFSAEVERVSNLDGLKIYFRDGGWLIARFSGTEPLLRVFCEMATEEEAEKLVKEFVSHYPELI